MSYLLKCVPDDGAGNTWYVAANSPDGSSYTKNLRYARQFTTREEADHNACGNERITTPEQEMRG